MITVDASFQIGEQHLKQGKPCQDYASAGRVDQATVFAVVSDGCSGGGRTDIGSRLLTLATEKAIREHPVTEEADIKPMIMARDAFLEVYRSTLGLDAHDLLATSITTLTTDTQIIVNLFGDGVVAWKYDEGLVLEVYSWENNTPYYPSYRLAKLDESFSTFHESSDEPFTRYVDTEEKGYSVAAGMAGITIAKNLDDVQEGFGRLQSVGIFSDGVEQIDAIETLDAVTELMAIKSFKGQFAVRRLNRFLKQAHDSGRGPIDDIAYAVIHLQDKEV